MRTTFRCAAAASLALLAGCRRETVPNQVLTKPVPMHAPPPPARMAGSWLYRSSPAVQRFIVDERAVIAVQFDTTTQTDTVSSHAEVAFTQAPAARGVNGAVSTFLVGGAGRPAATPTGLVTPFSFRASYPARNAQVEFAAPVEVTPCSSTQLAAAQSLRELWFQAPDTLRVGVTWSDSSSYVSCRDGIPLHSTVHRMFHVAASNLRGGRVLLSIALLSRTLIGGRGVQFGDSVAVTGAGSGQLEYEFDPAVGEVVTGTGNTTLDFSLRSSHRTQIVRQNVEIRIDRS